VYDFGVGVILQGFGQNREERAIQLNCHNFLRPRCEFYRQTANSGADFQDSRIRVKPGGGGDVFWYPRVDQEVLAEAFGKVKAMAGEEGFDDLDVA